MSVPKITKEQALEIREIYTRRGIGSAGLTTLAARYGVAVAAIVRVLNGTHPAAKGLPAIPRRRGSAYSNH